MIIGVPKEIKTREYRVGMTPAGVRSLTSHGHKVLVERSAGEGAGIVAQDQGVQCAVDDQERWSARVEAVVR